MSLRVSLFVFLNITEFIGNINMDTKKTTDQQHIYTDSLLPMSDLVTNQVTSMKTDNM